MSGALFFGSSLTMPVQETDLSTLKIQNRRGTRPQSTGLHAESERKLLRKQPAAAGLPGTVDCQDRWLQGGQLIDQSAFENALGRRRCLVLHEIAIYERLSYRTDIANLERASENTRSSH